MTVGAQINVDKKNPAWKSENDRVEKSGKVLSLWKPGDFLLKQCNYLFVLHQVNLLVIQNRLDLFPNRYSHQCSIETESSNCDKKQSLKK